jgi:hypothetical protein
MSTVTHAFSTPVRVRKTNLPVTEWTALLTFGGKEQRRESACTEKKMDTYVKFAPK